MKKAVLKKKEKEKNISGQNSNQSETKDTVEPVKPLQPPAEETGQPQKEQPLEKEAEQLQKEQPLEKEAEQLQKEQPSEKEAEQPQKEEPSEKEAEQPQKEQPLEKEAEQPQKEQSQKEETEQPQDEVDEEIAKVAAAVSGGAEMAGEPEDNDKTFHTVDDVKKIRENGENGNQGEDKNQGEGTKDILGKVKETEKGNVYLAVVLAKQLKGGGGNPLQTGGKRGKKKKFFNASTVDKAYDTMKLIDEAAGTLGDSDTEDKGSSVSKGISLISDFTALLASLRGLMDKAKEMKELKDTHGTTSDKVFTVIGMVTDIVTILAKGASMAKTIAELIGKKAGKIWDRVTMILDSVSYVGSAIGASRGLYKTQDKIGNLKKIEEDKRKGIKEIVAKYPPQESSGGSDGEDGGAEQTKEQQKEDSGAEQTKEKPKEDGGAEQTKEKPKEDGGAEQTKEKPKEDSGAEQTKEKPKEDGGAEQTKEKPKEDGGAEQTKEKPKKVSNDKKKDQKSTQKKAAELLKRDDVSKEEKEELTAYLALCRRIEKESKNLEKEAEKLLTSIIGFCSSIASGNGDNADAQADDLVAKDKKKGDGDVNDQEQDSDEDETIQENLWHMIDGMDDEKYGLKGIETDLVSADEKKESEVKSKADEAIGRYKKVDNLLETSGVDYKQLFAAPNLKEFKKGLIAGI